MSHDHALGYSLKDHLPTPQTTPAPSVLQTVLTPIQYLHATLKSICPYHPNPISHILSARAAPKVQLNTAIQTRLKWHRQSLELIDRLALMHRRTENKMVFLNGLVTFLAVVAANVCNKMPQNRRLTAAGERASTHMQCLCASLLHKPIKSIIYCSRV